MGEGYLPEKEKVAAVADEEYLPEKEKRREGCQSPPEKT